MNLLIDLFKSHLAENKALSAVTLKNYAADLSKFSQWFEKIYNRPFVANDLDANLISQFIASNESPRSAARYTSTLRRFSSFLTEKNLISVNPFSNLSPLTSHLSATKDPWSLKSFKNYLYTEGASSVTSKNYIVDLAAFTSWLTERGINATPDAINEYKDILIYSLNLSPSTINRKLSSIRKYLKFAHEKGILPEEAIPAINLPINTGGGTKDEKLNLETLNLIEDPSSNIQDQIAYSSFPPLRLTQKLLQPYLALENFLANKIVSISIPKKIIHHVRFTRPEWYKRYHKISATHYLHLAVLIIYASIVGLLLYRSLINNPNNKIAFASPITPPRILSFQGRLTDNNNNPITSPTNIRFIIYNDPSASGSAALWQDIENISPDNNGLFQVLLGATSNTIPSTLFQEHDILYLGITVGQTSELTPRQRIATVAYSANSESLQGMVPITATSDTSNVILALDSSGNLTIGGSANPTFESSGGQFTLSGQPLLLTTNTGSNGDVQIIPDGTGAIDAEGSIVNYGANGSIAPGGVQINDRAAVFATESAVAAFIVANDTTGGDIFAASSSGATRFVLTNTGDINLQPGMTIDTLSTGTISIGSNNATTLTFGRIGQGITLPGFTSQNGVLYGTYGTGELAQATTASTGLCLTSGSQSPTWTTCGGGSFTQSNGALYPSNQTLDLLIGGQATASAKFAILNVNGTGPVTATISGNLLLMARNGAGGNLGIGTVNPGARVHIKSGADENVLRLEDLDGTCDHNPEAGSEVVTCSSDERLKTNIVDASSVLPLLMQIKVRDYDVKASGDHMTGVIAQEIQQIAPQMVAQGSDGFLKVALPSPWVLLKAIQEVNSKIDSSVQTLTQIIYNQQSIINGEEFASPLASFDEIRTNIISPLGTGKDTIELQGNLAIKGSATVSGSLTAESASISGDLAANTIRGNQLEIRGNLSANNATISGTLYANNIEANSISGLEGRIKSLIGDQANYSSISAQTISMYYEQLASASGNLIASINNQQSIINNQLLDVRSISGDFGTFREGLISLGPATFAEATVMNTLSVGNTLTIGPNSINTLGDLEIQPLKQGAVSFLAGAVRIEVDGTLKLTGNAIIAGDLNVKGKIRTGNISSPSDQNLALDLSRDSSLMIHDSSSSAVLSINQTGDLNSSGSGTFNKLNLSLASPAYAISDTESVATGSAGLATLKSYRTELTIYNPNVTSKSLIYITPAGSTANKVIYLLRQTPAVNGSRASFTVGINAAVSSDIQFNWIIVN